MTTSIEISSTVAAEPFAGPAFDVSRVRRDFPILAESVRGRPLAYLDNAATTQKPASVIEAIDHYYRHDNANIHRGVHELSERATRAYEDARAGVQRFLNAADPREIVFTRGTTESINLVAASYGRSRLQAGDEIVLSAMEHHSNIVPWQMLCEQTGARLRVAPIDDSGALQMDEFERLLSERTRIVSMVHVSNALGTVVPVQRVVELAHRWGAVALIDGAQATAHMPVDVRALDCDFYALSGHKMLGPTGIGVLYGKAALLDAMPPYQGGGDMIRSVTFAKTVYNDLPHKFEAGTPHIAGGVGLGAAIDYLSRLDFAAVQRHEADLLAYGTRLLEEMPGLRIIGTAPEKAGVLSFVLGDIHPHDVGTVLDQEGIAVRTGHHCCQPVMQRFGVPATVRASLALYNTREELETLARALYRVQEVLG